MKKNPKTQSLDGARGYVRSIRNPGKRAYGADWILFLRGWRPEPDWREYECSYLAAQGVRHRLPALEEGEESP